MWTTAYRYRLWITATAATTAVVALLLTQGGGSLDGWAVGGLAWYAFVTGSAVWAVFTLPYEWVQRRRARRRKPKPPPWWRG